MGLAGFPVENARFRKGSTADGPDPLALEHTHTHLFPRTWFIVRQRIATSRSTTAALGISASTTS